MFTVYIIRSTTNDHYYVGYTEDINKRIKYHNHGKNRSTKNRGLWKVVYTEEFLDRKLAYAREKQIKSYKGGEAFKKLIK